MKEYKISKETSAWVDCLQALTNLQFLVCDNAKALTTCENELEKITPFLNACSAVEDEIVKFMGESIKQHAIDREITEI